MDGPDPIRRAAEGGLLDESRTRASLGGREPTAERLADLRIACARCGGPITRDGSALTCRPCNLRVDLAPDGRYELRRKLGQGGFGEVWLARDRDLGRDVAVKMLSSMSPDDLTRFRREARLAAKLSHPNIVPVYDVTDRTLVMEYIAGAPAGETPLTAERAADVVRQAAEGVEHAHRQGVVHRDLKPANILVAGDRAYVTDFGLAKQVGVESSLSVSGDIFGTPVYMAPEQARGRLSEIGPRTDVYSLGATLYDLLARRPPFQHAEVYEIIRQVIDEEPAPLPPGIAADLRTIVLKAMEKDPARRYASAGAMAADLRRFLDGEAIEARPANRWYRLRKRIRRNPPAWSAAAAALAVAMAAGWIGWRARQERLAREREAAALEVYRAAQTDFQGAMVSLLGGGGDESAARWMAAFESKLADARRIDPGFQGGWFERAQFCRITGDRGAAERNLREGLKRRPDDALGRIERGMLAAEEFRERMESVYERAIEEARRRAFLNKTEPRPPSHDDLVAGDETLSRLRDIVAREIRAGLDAAPELAELPWIRLVLAEMALVVHEPEAALRHVEGLEFALAKMVRGRIEAKAGRTDAAISLYEKAIATDRRCLLAYGQRALARLNGAIGRIAVGAPDAPEWIRRGIDECDEAIREFPGSAGFGGLRGEFRLRLAEWMAERNEDPTATLDAALADIEAEIAAHPDFEDERNQRARVWASRGLWESRYGGSPAASFERAAEYARRRGQADSDAARTEGSIWVNLAKWQVLQGHDAREALDRADAAFRQAIAQDPLNAKGHQGLAGVRLVQAMAAIETGGDVRGPVTEGLDFIDDALRIEGDDVEYLTVRAHLLSRQAQALAAAGEDPGPSMSEARSTLERAIRRNPGYASSRTTLGNLLMDLSVWEAANGREARPAADLGLAEIERASELAPDDVETLVSLGAGYLNRGEWSADHGDDPLPDYRKAADALDRGIVLSPADSRMHDNRGNVSQRIGDWKRRTGGDPIDDYRAAIASHTRAVEVRPDDAPPYQNRALAQMKVARWTIERGGNPEAEFDQAEASVANAIELNPSLLQAMQTAGDICLERADWLWEAGRDPSAELTRAAGWYQRVLAANENLSEAWGELGRTFFSQGEWAEQSRQDPSALYGRALEAFDRAIALKSDAWEALGNKGLLLRKMGRLEEALAALERALQINPAAQALRRDVEDLRRRMAGGEF